MGNPELARAAPLLLRDGGTVTYRHEYEARVCAAEPAGAAIGCRSSVEVRRAAGVTRVRAVSRFTAEGVTVQADVEQNGAVTFQRQWQRARAEGSS